MTDWLDYPAPGDGLQHTVTGTVKVLRSLYSPELDNERDILVYVPPGYEAGGRRYPVVYMHDGQNLFDAATSYAGEWRVDRTLEAASAEGIEAIVVGVPNSGGGRFDEYSPFVDPKNGGGAGDRYLRFLIDTVKPLVDRDFRTAPERATTGLAGSSLGGLISLYGLFRHPDVWGFAGVMSPALWVAGHAIFDWLASAPFPGGRIYIDVGTREGAREIEDVARLREMLLARGYRRGYDLLCIVEKGARHEEAAWAGRLQTALRFLLEGATGQA